MINVNELLMIGLMILDIVGIIYVVRAIVRLGKSEED